MASGDHLGQAGHGLLRDADQGPACLIEDKLHTIHNDKDGEWRLVTEIIANHVQFLKPRAEWRHS
jgi:single-stranded DNA-binding protein